MVEGDWREQRRPPGEVQRDVWLVIPDAYGSIRQHTAAYVSIRQHTSAYGRDVWRVVPDAYLTHTAAYGSIRQHTAAYVSIRQHTSEMYGAWYLTPPFFFFSLFTAKGKRTLFECCKEDTRLVSADIPSSSDALCVC